MNKSSARRKHTGIKAKKLANYKQSELRDPIDRRVLRFASQKSFDEAAEKTMAVMGFNVIARNGWVGKLYPDNCFEKISQIVQVTVRN